MQDALSRARANARAARHTVFSAQAKTTSQNGESICCARDLASAPRAATDGAFTLAPRDALEARADTRDCAARCTAPWATGRRT
eukprot:6622227-Pyramimonas_sp.AAC.1